MYFNEVKVHLFKQQFEAAILLEKTLSFREDVRRGRQPDSNEFEQNSRKQIKNLSLPPIQQASKSRSAVSAGDLIYPRGDVSLSGPDLQKGGHLLFLPLRFGIVNSRRLYLFFLPEYHLFYSGLAGVSRAWAAMVVIVTNVLSVAEAHTVDFEDRFRKRVRF